MLTAEIFSHSKDVCCRKCWCFGKIKNYKLRHDLSVMSVNVYTFSKLLLLLLGLGP